VVVVVDVVVVGNVKLGGVGTVSGSSLLHPIAATDNVATTNIEPNTGRFAGRATRDMALILPKCAPSSVAIRVTPATSRSGSVEDPAHP
jgi:hypothetical protein